MKRLLTVCAVVSLLACTNVDKGTVVKKSFTPAWTQYVQTCMAYDSRGFCSFYAFIPTYWPDEYDLKLRDDTQDRPEGDRDTGWVEVPGDVWKEIRLGDQYP